MTTAQTDIVERREAAEEEAAERFSLLLSGEATPDDRLEIDAWRASDPVNDEAWSRIAAIWHGSPVTAEIPAIKAMREAALTAGRPASAWRNWRPMALAASLVAAIACTPWLVSTLSSPDTTAGTQIASIDWSQPTRTRIGQIETVKLTDGSTMTINTDSAVRTALSSSARRIRLDRGEARFDVAKNPAAPFTVIADGISVTAIGTSFSVRDAGDQVFVTLAEGRVRVEGPAGNSVMLEPGSQVRADKDGFHVARVDPQRVMSWTSGMLDFNQAPLGVVVNELNRYAAQQIVLRAPGLAAMPITGVFPVGDQQRIIDMLVANGQIRVANRTTRAIELDRP